MSISLSPIRSRPSRTGSPSGLSAVAQRVVQRVDPELAAVHGREHLDVAHRIDAVVRRQPPADERRRSPRAPRPGRRARSGTGPGASPPRRANDGAPPRADRVRALHDHAPAAWRKMCASRAVGTSPARDQLRERLAGADGRELVGVADQHHVRSRADRAQQRHEQLEVRHRRLVDDQQVARQRVVLVGVGPSPGIQPSAECTVEAHEPARLAHPSAARPVGATSISDARCSRGDRADHADRRRLAGAGAAGDEREAVRERACARRPTARARRAPSPSPAATSLGRRVRRVQLRGRLVGQQRVHALGQLALERRRLGAVDPQAARRRSRGVLVESRSPASSISCTARSSGGASPPSSSPAAARSAPCGRHVEPSRSASASTCSTAARARARGCRAGTPAPRAIASAVAKPTPNTAVSSYGRSATTR